MCCYKDFIKEKFDSYEMFDDNDVYFLVKSTILDDGLSEYVDDIAINTSKKKHGSYISNIKRLVINPKTFYFLSFNLLPQVSNYPSKKSFATFYNLNCLNIIFHESCHVEQMRKYKEKSAGVGSSLQSIIDEGLDFGSRLPNHVNFKERLFYHFFYDKFLFERDAAISSLFRLLDLANELSIISRGERLYFNRMLLETCIKNYKMDSLNSGLISASEYYYQVRGKSDEFDRISFSENYDNITKISWGMPISRDFYLQLCDMRNEDLSRVNVKKRILEIKG